MRCLPCYTAPEEWGTADTWGVPPVEGFWASDDPVRKGAVAFGILDRPTTLRGTWHISHYELAAPLPEVPPELNVYMVGSYPATHRENLQKAIPFSEFWEYHPSHALVLHVAAAPIGERVPNATPALAEQKAREFLGHLLLPDSTDAAVTKTEFGWLVVFNRQHDGITFYHDKPFTVSLNEHLQIIGGHGRRRPLTKVSSYPARSPAEAWSLLQQGKGLSLYIATDPVLPEQIDAFSVTQVELAYYQGLAIGPEQPMGPFYLFRNSSGHTLAIPAVTEPYFDWP